jgi:hypothetical protein
MKSSGISSTEKHSATFTQSFSLIVTYRSQSIVIRWGKRGEGTEIIGPYVKDLEQSGNFFSPFVIKDRGKKIKKTGVSFVIFIAILSDVYLSAFSVCLQLTNTHTWMEKELLMENYVFTLFLRLLLLFLLMWKIAKVINKFINLAK